jgi:hypothetical protein
VCPCLLVVLYSSVSDIRLLYLDLCFLFEFYYLKLSSEDLRAWIFIYLILKFLFPSSRYSILISSYIFFSQPIRVVHFRIRGTAGSHPSCQKINSKFVAAVSYTLIPDSLSVSRLLSHPTLAGTMLVSCNSRLFLVHFLLCLSRVPSYRGVLEYHRRRLSRYRRPPVAFVLTSASLTSSCLLLLLVLAGCLQAQQVALLSSSFP